MSVFFSMQLDQYVNYSGSNHSWVTVDPTAVAPDYQAGTIRVHHLDVSFAENAGSIVDFRFGRMESYDHGGGGSSYFGGVMPINRQLPGFIAPSSPRGLDETLGSYYLTGSGIVLSLDFPDPIEAVRNHEIGGEDEGFAIWAQLTSIEATGVQMRVNAWAEVYR
jgi:hypothetical protein